MAFGAGFAALIINPNYTSHTSTYMRRLNVFIGAGTGYFWGKKKRDQHHLVMQLRVHDYLPHEVKMALKTKDHRYLALFDPETANRKLFDDETGKSLS